MEQWANYFAVTCESSATLTGLLFVGVSLNLKKILSLAQLADRALGTMMLLVNILIVSSFCLVPRQPASYLGIEILVLDLFIWVVVTTMDWRKYNSLEPQYRRYYFQNLVFTQLAILPYLAASVFFLVKSENGYYCLVTGITISFIKALTDSWVLLVEINR
jgi:modulator of FtsH protease